MPAKKKRAATAPSKSPQKGSAARKGAKKTATKAAPKKAAKKTTKKAAPRKAAPKKAAPKNAAPKKATQQAPSSKSAPKKSAPKNAAPRKGAVKTAPAARPATPSSLAPVELVVAEASPRRPAAPPDPTEELAQALAALALGKKAEDVLILRVTEMTSYADFFVLASAPSERQVQAIARHAAEEMKKAGRMPFGSEGLEQGHWVLVDYGAVVLHVFLGSARQYYDLEGFWAEAPHVTVDEPRGLEVLARLTEDNTEVDEVDEVDEIDESPALAANE